MIFKCWRHRANEWDVGGTVMQQSGDDFPSVQVDERLAGNFRAKRVLKKNGIVSAHAKDEQIARVAQDRVLQFVLVNLGKKLVGEGEEKLVLACLG